MVDARFKAKIVNALRKLSRTWPPRNRAKSSYKIDKALHKCAICGIYCYEGKSKSSFLKLSEKYGQDKVIFERGHMDHIEPVIDPNTGWQSWDILIEDRLFPEQSGWQHLCPPCHKEKSNKENKVRREVKKMNKIIALFLLTFLGCSKVDKAEYPKTLVLTDKNFVLFRDDFNEDSGNYFKTKFKYLADQGTKNPIYIVFDTNGGYEDIFSKVVSLANSVPNPVYTITINAVSAGYFSVQLIKGKRYITPDGKMMSHRWRIFPGFIVQTVPAWIKLFREKNEEELPFYQRVADRLGMGLYTYLRKIETDYYISKSLALSENHVDEELIIKCSDSIPEFEKYTMTTQTAVYEVERSGCPLLNQIRNVKLISGFPGLQDMLVIGSRLMSR